MAGNDDRIHAWNAIYRNGAGNNFDSFAMNAVTHRPDPFIFRVVNVPGAAAATLDHQGHIVPQNMLSTILDPIMQDMANNCANLAAVGVYIGHHIADHPWMQNVFNYGIAVGAPMFDFDEAPGGGGEDRAGGFFSIITWNPVNICRAPVDAARGNVPGNNIDAPVVAHLNQPAAAPGLNAAWHAALNTVAGNPNAANMEAYITACSATLPGQLHAGIGYYAFPWHSVPGANGGPAVLAPM